MKENGVHNEMVSSAFRGEEFDDDAFGGWRVCASGDDRICG